MARTSNPWQTPRVVFNPGVYRGIQRGINQLANAIRPTLGPLPRFVFDKHFGTGYLFWNCALSYSAAPWQLTLARFGTNDRASYLYGSEATEDRWSLGLQWQFGGVAR